MQIFFTEASGFATGAPVNTIPLEVRSRVNNGILNCPRFGMGSPVADWNSSSPLNDPFVWTSCTAGTCSGSMTFSHAPESTAIDSRVHFCDASTTASFFRSSLSLHVSIASTFSLHCFSFSACASSMGSVPSNAAFDVLIPTDPFIFSSCRVDASSDEH